MWSNIRSSNKYNHLLACSSVSYIYRIMIIRLREVTHPKGNHWITSIIKGKRFLNTSTDVNKVSSFFIFTWANYFSSFVKIVESWLLRVNDLTS